jgi:hypothetical protein
MHAFSWISMHEYWISVPILACSKRVVSRFRVVRYAFDSIKAQVMSGPAWHFLCARDHREKYNVHVEVNQKTSQRKMSYCCHVQACRKHRGKIIQLQCNFAHQSSLLYGIILHILRVPLSRDPSRDRGSVWPLYWSSSTPLSFSPGTRLLLLHAVKFLPCRTPPPPPQTPIPPLRHHPPPTVEAEPSPPYRQPAVGPPPPPILTSTAASDDSPPNPQPQPRHRAPSPPPALIHRSAWGQCLSATARTAPGSATGHVLRSPFLLVTALRTRRHEEHCSDLGMQGRKGHCGPGRARSRASTVAWPARISVSNILTILFLTWLCIFNCVSIT